MDVIFKLQIREVALQRAIEAMEVLEFVEPTVANTLVVAERFEAWLTHSIEEG